VNLCATVTRLEWPDKAASPGRRGLVARFGRNTPPADLEETVRRRIVGNAPDTTGPDAEECPAQLLRRLAEALKHEQTELSTIKVAVGGFLVNGVRGGTAFRRWYPVQEVRQLARSGGDEAGL